MKVVFPSLVLLVLLPFLLASTVAPPILQVSISATVQSVSPLQVVGFIYSDNAIQVVLSNKSNKAIRDLIVIGQLNAPAGCAIGSVVGVSEAGRHFDKVRIDPHGEGTTTIEGSPFSPTSLIVAAKDLRTAYLVVQVAVVEVDFADGTKWRSDRMALGIPGDDFHATVENRKCQDRDVDLRVGALLKTDKVAFRSDVGTLQSELNSGRSNEVPRLAFRCSLERSEAICPHR